MNYASAARMEARRRWGCADLHVRPDYRSTACGQCGDLFDMHRLTPPDHAFCAVCLDALIYAACEEEGDG